MVVEVEKDKRDHDGNDIYLQVARSLQSENI